MKLSFPSVICAVALFTAHIAPAAAQGLPGATARPDGGTASQSDRQEMRERCKAEPQKCREEMKARREEWCKANPQRCEEMKAKMTQRQEQCKADPQKCREEMKARREEWCKANPQRCEEMKARFEKRREECKVDPDKCRDGKHRSSDGK
jgi:TolA-binding protein